MALSHPPSPSPYPASTAVQHPPVATATLLPSELTASHFAAYHTYHRDLCRHAATLPRQLSDHYNNLQTLRSTSRSFSSHLARLTTRPPTATTTSVLERFTGGVELLHMAVLQQLDVALARMVECVGTLGGGVESLTRLCDSLRTSATAVDVQLLVLDVAAVREMEKIAGSTAGSPLKAAGRGSATGSHRKQKPIKQQPATQDDDSDPSLTAAISPHSLLLTLEDIVFTLTALQQQQAAALTQLQTAVRGGRDKSEEEMREALDVLGSIGSVNGSMLEEWLSIIRRACKV